MGKKMAGTNEFAFFRCKSICTGGGPESGRKNSKNAFRPVPVQKFTFPAMRKFRTDFCIFSKEDRVKSEEGPN